MPAVSGAPRSASRTCHPFIPGMAMSRRMSSGIWRVATSMPSAPPPASSTSAPASGERGAQDAANGVLVVDDQDAARGERRWVRGHGGALSAP